MKVHKNTENLKQKTVTFACLAMLWSAAPLAMADCATPSFSGSIPDGKSASADEMARAQNAVSDFVKAGEAYIACVEASESRTQAQRMRDSMLDEMEKAAAQFNRQLRTYKKANS